VDAAADALEEHADAIARRALELIDEALPKDGRRQCEEDAAFHVRFLIGSLAAGDTTIFADYARWAAALLANEDVPAASLVAMLESTETAVREIVPDAAPVASLHLKAGVDALDR
jgi:hypothetical protein